MLYCLEDYPGSYGQFTQMCVDRFLTWQIRVWDERRKIAPAKFVPVYEEERALISKLRCLNRRVNRGNTVGRNFRVKHLELFIKNGRRKQPIPNAVHRPPFPSLDEEWLPA